MNQTPEPVACTTICLFGKSNHNLFLAINKMASYVSGNFKKVDETFCVDGGINADHVSGLTPKYRGAMYLCGDDSG